MVRACFRKSPILSALALPAGVLVAVGAILAQNVQNPGASPDDIPVFTADTRLVVVHASVLDQKGKLVTNLQQPAFKVLENGVEQPIKIAYGLRRVAFRCVHAGADDGDGDQEVGDVG